MYICMYICTYIYMDYTNIIYIYIERDRVREMYVLMHAYTYI